ncbi:hypothetical protein EW146_g10147, partial [Bondarzewia mesenterica]
ASNDSFSYPPEHSVLQAHFRSKVPQSQTSRPLSSADEAGPVLKKLRSSGAHQRAGEVSTKASKLPTLMAAVAADDARLKKACARPALTLSNFFSSSAGHHQQSAMTSSRNVTAVGGAGKLDRETSLTIRRSAWLMTGGNDTNDLILNQIRCVKLFNNSYDHVKDIFCPDFLSSNGPVLSLDYEEFHVPDPIALKPPLAHRIGHLHPQRAHANGNRNGNRGSTMAPPSQQLHYDHHPHANHVSGGFEIPAPPPAHPASAPSLQSSHVQAFHLVSPLPDKLLTAACPSIPITLFPLFLACPRRASDAADCVEILAGVKAVANTCMDLGRGVSTGCMYCGR